MAGLFTLRDFARNLLRGSRSKKYLHIFVLLPNLVYEPKEAHYLLDHCDFISSERRIEYLYPEYLGKINEIQIE